jgi:transcription elongation GreA/GreB family factor
METPEQIAERKAAEEKAAQEKAAQEKAEKDAGAAAAAKPKGSGGGKKAKAAAVFADDGDDEETKSFTVIGPAAGRRRAGMQFGKEPRTVDLTLAQYRLIEADPDMAIAPA